jgi:hypothetical protein
VNHFHSHVFLFDQILSRTLFPTYRFLPILYSFHLLHLSSPFLTFGLVNSGGCCNTMVPATNQSPRSSTLARKQGGAKQLMKSLNRVNSKSDTGSLNDFGSISDLGHTSIYSTDLSVDLELFNSTLSSPHSFDIGFPSMRSFGNKLL